MSLRLKIAIRYLFARKSYNVINLISGIGVAGMALGTAALVVILSVFNGFNRIVSDSISDVSPDIAVLPSSGKVFDPDSLRFLLDDDDIVTLSSVLEEQVFVSYDGKQSLARIKGMDAVAEAESSFRRHVIAGEWSLHRGDIPCAVVGAGVSQALSISPYFLTPLEVFYPSRTASPSLANPAATLRKASLQTGGVFSVNAEMDSKLILVPISVMRDLLEYTSEVSSLEIWAAPGAASGLAERLSTRLGSDYKVLDRYQQNESVFKMMRYEKLAIYVILIFVVIIIAFNIYSSLKMLVIEKQGDIGTLRALGAQESMIRKVFCLEGWFISILGMLIGLILGILAVWLQARFGLVPMPGNFLVSSYPVVLKAMDLVWISLGVAAVGWIMALIPSRKL